MADFLPTSIAFAAGGTIPRRHSCDGEDRSPPLSWTAPPTGSRSLALILDDPDAPGGGSSTGWPGASPGRRWAGRGQGGSAGGTERLRHGRLPRLLPTPRSRASRYRFRLHALGEKLRLTSGAGVAELERVLTGNLLAVAELVGTYER
jgi:phosphatidylethanolamine-binding protein (PEBP) family uncharacterized protein